jgi:hypothetical protein
MQPPLQSARPSLYVDAVAIHYGGRWYWVPRRYRRAVRKLWDGWKAGRPFVRLAGRFDSVGGLVVSGPERGGPVGTVCLSFVSAADVLVWTASLL